MECRARLRLWIRLAVSAIPLLAMPAVAAQLSLSWVDNATNEAGFRIERSLITSTTYVPIASVGPQCHYVRGPHGHQRPGLLLSRPSLQ